MKWKLLFELFVVFFKIGPISFGGGYAMIPLIEREIIDKKKWIRSEEVSEVFAIAGTAPGAIAVNAAIFIGYRLAGFLGALAAMIGVLLPTTAIVMLLGSLYFLFKDNALVEGAFLGIRAAVVGLITYAGIKVARTSIIDKPTFILFFLILLSLLFLHLNPILAIFIGALAGILTMTVKKKIQQKREEKTHFQNKQIRETSK
ncbi:chromate transporter [Mesobacillus stamsii]|uniref:Chromate transporter n=1 Tax=Mesobacillus stamsii TaxID=225347 RepID=A0ABU0FVF0_9BACI|nr:chromate transporter [Mesobacillus stamsii]MDQ0413349.1 chromate transporter [Mesobacillus stamsii]